MKMTRLINLSISFFILIIGLFFIIVGCNPGNLDSPGPVQEQEPWVGCWYDTENGYTLEIIERVEETNVFDANLQFDHAGGVLSLTGELRSGDTATLTIENWEFQDAEYTVTYEEGPPALLEFEREGFHPVGPPEMDFVRTDCVEGE